MKKLLLNPSFSSVRKFSYQFVALAGLLAFVSCKKEEPVSDTAIVRIINTAATVGTFNIYVDDKAANTAAIPFGGSIAYAQVLSGAHTFKFTTASSIQSLFSQTLTLNKDNVYSYFLVGKLNTLDGLLVIDSAPAAAADKAYIRFANLSPDADALDLKIAEGASLVTNKAYKTISTYTAIDPKTYNFEIKDNKTGNNKTTLDGVVLTAGRFYTIISRGLLSPDTNEQGFSAQSIINQ